MRLTELDVSLGTLDAFLAVLAAESAVRAAAATVERMEAFEESVSVLVENELRAGADLSLARAELARARTEVDGTELIVSGPRTDESSDDPDPGSHPLVARERAAVAAAAARKDAAWRSSLPEIDVIASLYSRGTGALLDGSFEGGSSGLWPDRSNWALGVSVRFPFLVLPESQQQKAIEDYRARAAAARQENAVHSISRLS